MIQFKNLYEEFRYGQTFKWEWNITLHVHVLIENQSVCTVKHYVPNIQRYALYTYTAFVFFNT